MCASGSLSYICKHFSPQLVLARSILCDLATLIVTRERERVANEMKGYNSGRNFYFDQSFYFDLVFVELMGCLNG